MARLCNMYDANSQTLTRIKTGEATTTNLIGCDSLSFSIFQRTPSNNTFQPYPTTMVTKTKLVELTWNCSRKVLGATANTEGMQSAKIVIRKKALHLASAQSQRGSVLVTALVFGAIAGIMLVACLQLIESRRVSVMRSHAWNSAIPVLEAGIEEAFTHLKVDNSDLTANGWTRTSPRAFIRRPDRFPTAVTLSLLFPTPPEHRSFSRKALCPCRSRGIRFASGPGEYDKSSKL